MTTLERSGPTLSMRPTRPSAVSTDMLGRILSRLPTSISMVRHQLAGSCPTTRAGCSAQGTRRCQPRAWRSWAFSRQASWICVNCWRNSSFSFRSCSSCLSSVLRGTRELPACWVSCWTEPAMPKRGRNNPPKASLILVAGCSGRLSSTSTINSTKPVAMEYCRFSICHPIVTMGRTRSCSRSRGFRFGWKKKPRA